MAKDPDETPTPVEIPGPRRTSINLPLWQQSCLELAARLRLTPTAIRLARAIELEEMAKQFERFTTHPPSDAERVAALARFMDIQAAALDLITGHSSVGKQR